MEMEDTVAVVCKMMEMNFVYGKIVDLASAAAWDDDDTAVLIAVVGSAVLAAAAADCNHTPHWKLSLFWLYPYPLLTAVSLISQLGIQ